MVVKNRGRPPACCTRLCTSAEPTPWPLQRVAVEAGVLHSMSKGGRPAKAALGDRQQQQAGSTGSDSSSSSTGRHERTAAKAQPAGRAVGPQAHRSSSTTTSEASSSAVPLLSGLSCTQRDRQQCSGVSRPLVIEGVEGAYTVQGCSRSSRAVCRRIGSSSSSSDGGMPPHRLPTWPIPTTAALPSGRYRSATWVVRLGMQKSFQAAPYTREENCPLPPFGTACSLRLP